ncbi:hypothetical protein H6P81_004114 [Aristolochia fimbriata]|uniref:PRISE-like Rossmann-fold domain-containing protein n=1 Tax=Aristolochia fimbriata TaxID=158543 RepID=A0AAV7FFK4_ARIFI|nr:hypothetical protein H6P81_004114 [Aristolochia fimbriata]
MEFSEKPTSFSVALIVGVTGMVGCRLAEAMRKTTAPGGPWKIYGAARRANPAWFPTSLLDAYIQFDALDRRDTQTKLAPVARAVTHLFWGAYNFCADEEMNVKTNSAMLTNVLEALTTSLRHVTIQTGTKHYMGPIVDPTLATRLGSISVDPPFREDTPRRPFPNFYYALEDVAASYSELKNITWSVHRSSIILGASPRSIHNMLFTLSVYAEICRYEGTPFRFPGTRYAWEHFCDASDSGLLADQQLWAATADAAKNQAFNCTNGDVFAWKSFWRVAAEALKVEYFVVPYEEEAEAEGFDWVETMKGKGNVWDAIVKEYGLVETKMEEITCFDIAVFVFNFGFQHVCSMNKSREFGFLASVDTLKSIPVWIERMREMNLIPRW